MYILIFSLLIKSFMFVKHDFTGHDLSKSDLGNFQFLMKYVNKPFETFTF